MLLPLLVLLWFRFIIAEDDGAVVDTAAPVAAAADDLGGALSSLVFCPKSLTRPSFTAAALGAKIIGAYSRGWLLGQRLFQQHLLVLPSYIDMHYLVKNPLAVI